MNAQTSSDYEAKANRLRGQIGATIQDLRFSLTPSKSRVGSGGARGNR